VTSGWRRDPHLITEVTAPWSTERVPGTGQPRQILPVSSKASRTGLEEGIDLAGRPRGYVSESAIHDGPYNYFKNWDYAGLIGAWNADDGHGLGLTATTGGELADAISKARKHKGGPPC
jgi:hypothetical protein